MTPKNAAKNKIRKNITKMLDKFDDSPQRMKVEIPSTSSTSSFPYLTHFSSTTYRSAFKKFKKWKKEFEPTLQDAETMTDEYELLIAELKMYASCCMSERRFKAIMDAVGIKIRKRKKHMSIKHKTQQIEDPSEQAALSEQAGPSEQTSPSEQAGPSELAGPSTSTASYSPSYQSLLLKKESLKFEIDNIRKVISCYVTAIKRWLSIIENEPEQEEYLQEYRTQADRLHELQRKENELQDQQEELEELEKSRELKKMGTEENKEKILLVHLPNNQRTNIKIIEGLTLRDALTIPMQRRHLNLEDCVAYVCKRRFPHIISWDAVISTLRCEEVFVETLELISIPVYFTHNFVDNTFLLGQCCFCKKAVLHGWHCTECNRKFHTKCRAYAPVFCEHLKKRRIYYERLLANNETLGIVQIAPRPVLVPSYSRKRQYLKYKMMFEPPVHKEDKTTGMKEEEEEEDDEDEEEIYKKEPILRYKYKLSIDNAKANNDFEEKHDKKSANEVDPDVDSANNDFENIFYQENYYDEAIRIIENKDIIYGDNIGQGSFGKVMKGWIEYQGDVAVKKLWIENPTQENIETFKNEVLILQRLRHEHVLSLLGCTVKPKLGIVTELCENQSLYERLYDDLNTPIELITLVIISKQTAIAMEYLHSQNIIHRDLKSKNIFFYNGLHVKIGDFGLAIKRDDEIKEQVTNNDTNDIDDPNEKEEKAKKREEQKKKKEKQEKRVREKQLAGSVSWMAPEVLRKKLDEDPYTFQSDVYSFGIVLYELFARQLPYGNKADALYILYNVGRCALSPDLTKLRADTPKKIKKILIQCLDFNKEERPLFPYISRRTYAAFKFTPKIRRTTSLPIDAFQLANTYVEKTNDAQVPLTSEIEDFTDSYITDDTAPPSPVTSIENSVEDLQNSVENLFEKVVSEVYFLREQYRLAKRLRLV